MTAKEFFKSKVFWFSLAGLALLVVFFVFASGDEAESENPSSTPPSTTPPTNQQTLKTYKCETKKVCQGREGYANWVKTGTQKKCIASNVSQGLCIADCKGTCSTWE